MQLTPLMKAMALAGLIGNPQLALRLDIKQAAKDEEAKRRTTSENHQLQKQRFDAAEAKRQRRCARNLAFAGKTQEELL